MAAPIEDNGIAPQPGLWTIDWIGGCLGEIPEKCAHFKSGERPIFDLASVTKVVVTGTLMADLFAEFAGDLESFFSQSISDQVPELKESALRDLKVGELWEHRSGLQAHRLLFSSKRARFSNVRSEIWAKFLNELQHEKLILPKSTIYSDLGILLLGLWIERSRKSSLDQIFSRWKMKFGLAKHDTLRYGVRPDDLNRAVPTEIRHEVGDVNDDNCYSMGGIASHAGLFGTVEDVWAWLEAIHAWAKREPKLAQYWLKPREGIERFHAGWDTPSVEVGGTGGQQLSQAGADAPTGTIGHLGFTGTAVWWNPQTLQAGVLLSNRVRPSDSMQSRALIRKLRQEFFKKLWHNERLGGESWKAVVFAQ